MQSMNSDYDYEEIRRKALQGPRVNSLIQRFENIADGTAQVPGSDPAASAEFLSEDPEYRAYHNIFQRNIGTFYRHGCASIPFLIEENIRVGIALSRWAKLRHEHEEPPLTFYETSSADGSNARTLSEYSEGLIRTLTDSPNEANRMEFERLCTNEYSAFHKGPFVDITPEFLSTQHKYPYLGNKFDVIWENTTFQMYGSNRIEQIAYVRRVLHEDGLMLFLEKMNHANTEEYRKREQIKDTEFKSRYFSPDELEAKKTGILAEMEKGQVTLQEFIVALKRHFKVAYLIWNSANFYEIAASNSEQTVRTFLDLLPEPSVPKNFIFETPMVRALW